MKKLALLVLVVLSSARAVPGFGSTHGFSGSTGGGVDLAVSRHVAIRPQFDYLGLRFSNGTTHAARASINAVFRFGGR